MQRLVGDLEESERVYSWMRLAKVRQTWRTAHGAMLGRGPSGHPDDGAAWSWVDLPGAALDLVDAFQVVDFMRSALSMGGVVTRLDLAVDFLEGSGAHLIQSMSDAFDRSEVCGFRVAESHRTRRPGLDPHGLMLTLGRRGKLGSGRYVRIYDKGLQTGEAAVGQWVRFEVEFTGSVADDAARFVANVSPLTISVDAAEAAAEGDPGSLDLYWAVRAAEAALGSVDVREATGDRHLDRRPRVGWWADLVDRLDVRMIRARRKASTLAGKIREFTKAQAPLLRAIREELGCSMAEAVGLLTDPKLLDLSESESRPRSESVRRVVRELREVFLAPTRFVLPSTHTPWWKLGA